MIEIDGELIRINKVSWIGKVQKDQYQLDHYFKFLCDGRHKEVRYPTEGVVKSLRQKLVQACNPLSKDNPV